MPNLTIQLQFHKSPSPQFPRALAIAECAYKFSTAGEGRNTLYIATFDNNIEQLNLFQKIFQIVRSRKGVSLEINGMPVKSWDINKTVVTTVLTAGRSALMLKKMAGGLRCR